jgi:hypothetical protein
MGRSRDEMDVDISVSQCASISVPPPQPSSPKAMMPNCLDSIIHPFA